MTEYGPEDEARVEARIHRAEELEASAIELLVKTNVALSQLRDRLETSDEQRAALLTQLAATAEQTKCLQVAMTESNRKIDGLREQIKPLIELRNRMGALAWATAILAGVLMAVGTVAMSAVTAYKWLGEHFRGSAAP